MRKITALAATGAVGIALATAATPAQAAEGTTTVALTVVDGTLAIVTTAAAPGASSALVGTNRIITAPLGQTTITDTRAASKGWSLSATTTAFTPTLGGANIPASAAKFSLVEAPVKTLGTATYTHTSSPNSSGALATAAAEGVNTTTVLPVLTVDVPATAAAGAYTGTVTQSVV